MRFRLDDVDAVKFWARVDKSGECWRWLGFVDGKGYGRFNLPGVAGRKYVSESAYRVAWAIENGPIPPGGHILHNCDNPICVRPAHLRVGTHADNMRDMKERKRANGRGKPGEDAPHAVLTWPQVREIRRRYAAETISHEALARDFGVNRATITYLLNGHTWKEPA